MLVPVLCLLTFLFTSRIVLAQSEPIRITAGLTESARRPSHAEIDLPEQLIWTINPGRVWRSTEDTSIAVSLMRGTGRAWANWRRGKAYYAEGELLWLDADTLIRSLTLSRRSLDNFEKLFLGRSGDTGPAILPYTLAEVIQDLNEIAPNNWGTFFQRRVVNLQPRADLDGIIRGGYRLVYTEHPTIAEQILSDPDNSLPVNGSLNVSLP